MPTQFKAWILFFILPSLAFASERPALFTARGIVLTRPYRAQENTLDAITAVYRWNQDHPLEQIMGVEVHVVVTDEGELVCSHDENLTDLTGLDLDLHQLTRSQIIGLQIKQVLDGIDYKEPRPFAFFEQISDALLANPQPLMIWLNLKDKFYRPWEGPSASAQVLVQRLLQEHWFYLKKFGIDLFDRLILSSDNPFIVQALQQQAEILGIQNELQILADYFDWDLPDELWHWFIDEEGGYERLFDLTSNWVSFQRPLLNTTRIDSFRNTGYNIIGWDLTGPDDPFFHQVDVVLASY